MRLSLHTLRRALVLVLILTLLVPPAPVHGWKSNAHVYLAEIARLDALDGSITLPRYDPATGLPTGADLGPYPVDPRIRLALQHCPAQYRAGALGPDAYPDVATGQLLTHPDNLPASASGISGATDTSQWINALWAAAPVNLVSLNGNSACTVTLAKTAFAVGYLTHTAGDMYGHTFINYFAGGAFDLKDNALQHIIIEGYADALIPDDQTPDFYNISIENAVGIIYDVLVNRLPGKTLVGHITDNKANLLSIPRFFNGMRALPAGLLNNYNATLNDYQARIDSYNRRADACSWRDTSCSATWLRAQAAALQVAKTTYQAATKLPREYCEAWIADIDDGLWKWVLINHEIALAELFKPDAGRPEDILLAEKLVDYITLELEPMTPVPDAVGVVMRWLIPLGYPDFIDSFLMWGDSVFDYVKDYDLYGGLTYRKWQQYATSPASLFDIAVLLGSGPAIYRQQFRQEHLNLPPQTGVDAVDTIRNDATVQSLAQQARGAVGEQKVHYIVTALDRAASLENSLTQEVKDRLYLETLDYLQIPAMRNTVAMDKLIMISRQGMDQLLADIAYRCPASVVPTPIMLGPFMTSLDESDQGLDPQVTRNVASHGTSTPPDNRLLMGLARDPLAYRTVLQLQEGHSPEVLEYLSQSTTQCPADAQYRPCTARSMTLAASYALPSGQTVTDIQLNGGQVYLSAGTDGLHILDLPSLLSGADALVSHLPLRQDYYAHNVLLAPGMPVVQAQSPLPASGTVDMAYISDGQEGMLMLDVSIPASPELILDFTRMQPGVFSSYSTDTYGLVRTNNRLYASAGYNGVIVFDTSATDDLNEYDTIIPARRLIQNPVEEDFNVLDVDLLDANTLIVTTSRYLFAYDINPAAVSPIMLGYVELPDTAYRTIVSGGRAYVADGRAGLLLYDLSGVRSGSSITLLGSLDLPGEATDVAVQNNSSAFLAAGEKIYIIDTANPSSLKASCPLYEPAARLQISGSHLLVGGAGTLKIYSLPAAQP